MKLLLVDDEKILSNNIAKKLEQSWYNVDVASSMKEFFQLDTNLYSLIIVDLSLGDGSGFDIIKHVREEKNLETPIIIISGHSSDNHKIEWLDIWADDYITKPFTPDELMARIRSVMRRQSNTSNTSSIQYKDIEFNLTTREVTKGGEILDFTKKEKQIIEFFLFHKNKLVSKRQLVEALWHTKEYDYVTDNTINVTIYKVRKKLGENFKLETKIGEGYILEE